ncbi:hypothetical protein Q31a_20750 [Aureliella helgolandensis]|uniref:Uncharacterized protein n=1 Tax=Aureliella helgolandensis TaxID=2527968 RepID=A0A518G5C6_9BACT|nr:hypothetical protein Q31a_20750 [Aureliella helgolandensis]
MSPVGETGCSAIQAWVSRRVRRGKPGAEHCIAALGYLSGSWLVVGSCWLRRGKPGRKQEAGSRKQEAGSRKQEARSKKQEARSKKQEARKQGVWLWRADWGRELRLLFNSLVLLASVPGLPRRSQQLAATVG